MRYLVTPEFSSKMSSLPPDGVLAVARTASFVSSATKENFATGTPDMEIRSLSTDIYIIRHGRYAVYTSLGDDQDGAYALFLDVSAESPTNKPSAPEFFALRDPRTNPRLDPNKNYTIDPRRNMMVDPKRNMTIDPHRNMTIDPKRNMMIDPNRNMMIDPHRNMMIDPKRNMMIDPKRNMMIDPRRNRFYGGPYIYNRSLAQEGFLVRANDQISLIFDQTATFTHFTVATDAGIEHVFDTSRRWAGFLVPAEEVRLRFDTANHWIGIVV